MSELASRANGSRPSAAVMHLLPELAHNVRGHLNTHQLACAARVCRAWYEIWMPYLWESVHYHVPGRAFPPLGKHAAWIRRFDGRHLTGGYPTKEDYSHRQSRVAVNRREKGGGGGVGSQGGGGGGVTAAVAAAASTGGQGVGRFYDTTSSLIGLLPSQPLLLQLDLLRLEGSHLRQLSLAKTDITLDRLDQLLAALPRLQIFSFEVLNRIAPDFVPRSVESRPVGTWVGKSMGLLHEYEQPLLGVVATRLRRLRTLELTFDAKTHLHVGWVLFLLDALRHTLHTLKLENCDFSGSHARVRRDWNVLGIQPYVERLLDHDPSYMGASMAWASCSTPTTSPPTSGSVSHSSSSTSLDAVTTTPLSATSITTASSPLERAVASLTRSIEPLALNDKDDAAAEEPPFSATTPAKGLVSLTLTRQHWNNNPSVRPIDDILRACPNLEELNIHDAVMPGPHTITAILEHNPRLKRLALSKMPTLTSESLELLFKGRRWTGTEQDLAEAAPSSPLSPPPPPPFSLAPASNSSSSSSLPSLSFLSANTMPPKAGSEGSAPIIMVPQLENVRLGYLHQSLTAPLKALAEQHGGRLRRLSIHWCPSVTTQDVWPILKKCERLEDLALQLTKVSTKIFEEIPQEMIVTEPGGVAVQEPKMETWACAGTLRRLDIGGPMFVDYSRYRERFLRPTVYHHLSPNPYLIGTPASSSSSSGATMGTAPLGNGVGSSGSSNNSNSQDLPNSPTLHPSVGNNNNQTTMASSVSVANGSTPPSPVARSGAGVGGSTTTAGVTGTTTGTTTGVVTGHTFNSSIVRIAAMFNNFVPPPNHHPHVERHWTDESLNPLYTLQKRLEGFPRLRELGLQTKGIEQWILQGFHQGGGSGSAGVGAVGGLGRRRHFSSGSGYRHRGTIGGGANHGRSMSHSGAQSASSPSSSSSSSLSPTVASTSNSNSSSSGAAQPSNQRHPIRIRTLTLMNQQGRILDRSRVLELIASYPYLRRLICDRATIFHHRLTPAEKEDLERIFAHCDIQVVQI